MEKSMDNYMPTPGFHKDIANHLVLDSWYKYGRGYVKCTSI